MKADLAGNLRLLVSAVDDLCPTSGGGRCSSLPKAVAIAAPKAGRLPMMLSEFDLPPVAGVERPWAGTTPRRAVQNVAATTCDQSSFHGHGWRHDATRSFLIPGAHLATAFGLTETVGRLSRGPREGLRRRRTVQARVVPRPADGHQGAAAWPAIVT